MKVLSVGGPGAWRREVRQIRSKYRQSGSEAQQGRWEGETEKKMTKKEEMTRGQVEERGRGRRRGNEDSEQEERGRWMGKQWGGRGEVTRGSWESRRGAGEE
mgnify:CR=1 FL=1